MNKKDKQRLVTKRFMETISDTYGLVIDEHGESGTIDFAIDVRDSDGEAFSFNYRRSYGDVLCWKLKGEKDYEQAFNLECEMQQILHKIINQVDELC